MKVNVVYRRMSQIPQILSFVLFLTFTIQVSGCLVLINVHRIATSNSYFLLGFCQRSIQLREKGGRATTSVSEMGEFIETLDVVAGEKGF